MSPSLGGRTWSWVKELSFYLLVVLALVLYIESTKGDTLQALRDELNDVAARLCEQGQAQAQVSKYNTLVDALIVDYTERKAENEARGDFEKASINATTLGKFSLAKIEFPKQNCNRPLLPGR